MEQRRERHELWDGNIEWSLPPGFVDVRTLRDLPQNQEVFMAGETLAESKSSYSMDLMQLQEENDVRVQWDELCDLNNATRLGDEVHIVSCKVATPPGGSELQSGQISVPVAFGEQLCAEERRVRVFCALIRIKQTDTDVVVTWNEDPPSPNVETSKEEFEKLLMSIKWNDISFMG